MVPPGTPTRETGTRSPNHYGEISFFFSLFDDGPRDARMLIRSDVRCLVVCVFCGSFYCSLFCDSLVRIVAGRGRATPEKDWHNGLMIKRTAAGIAHLCFATACCKFATACCKFVTACCKFVTACCKFATACCKIVTACCKFATYVANFRRYVVGPGRSPSPPGGREGPPERSPRAVSRRGFAGHPAKKNLQDPRSTVAVSGWAHHRQGRAVAIALRLHSMLACCTPSFVEVCTWWAHHLQ